MELIGRKLLDDFANNHADSRDRLKRWSGITDEADWKNIMDIREVFRDVDYVPNKNRYVFNVEGNNYRVITQIMFVAQTVRVTNVFTHAEYNRWNKT